MLILNVNIKYYYKVIKIIISIVKIKKIFLKVIIKSFVKCKKV